MIYLGLHKPSLASASRTPGGGRGLSLKHASDAVASRPHQYGTWIILFLGTLVTLQCSMILWHDTTHFMAAWRMALRCCRKRSQARDDRRSFTSSCTALRAALGPACADLSVASSAFNATQKERARVECVKTSKVHSPHSLPLCGEMTLTRGFGHCP